MGRLDEVINKLNKGLGEEIIKKGIARTQYVKIPFTSPRMNYMTYGGIARGKVLEICGMEGGGKTTLTLDLCGNAQKIFEKEYEEQLKQYQIEYETLLAGGKAKEKAAAKLLPEIEEFKENGPKVVAYFDLENTLQVDWAETLGVDTEKLLLIRPETQTGEQVLQLALDLIDSGGVGLLVLDSLPMLVPQQIYDETLEKKSMGGIAKLLADFSTRVTPKLTVNDCTLIGLNQVRENLSGYGAGLQTPGGRSWRHLCSMRIMVKKGDFLDAKCNIVPKKSNNPQGNIIEVSIEKTKTCKPDRKGGSCTLNYYYGINKLYDLVQLALEYKYIIQSGSWFSIINPSSGEVLIGDDDKPLKFQGLPKLLDTLNETKDLTDELSDMLKEEYMEEGN